MRKVKHIAVGNCVLDGSHIYIQSMLNKPAHDIEASVEQAKKLEAAGCEIIRAAIPDMEAVKLVWALKEELSVPVVADIHYDYKLALAAADAGVDKIRINPGNIGDDSRVKAVADKCREKNIPIRIGVNSGSLEKELLDKYGSPTAEALVESAMRHVRLLNKFDFDNIVISLKASDVRKTIEAYRLMAQRTEYPLHLGVTEAGTERMGLVKSSIGIGSLLADGIGETIRVSLTADPILEVRAARDILKALGLVGGAELVSCPTCGRTKIDLVRYAHDIEEATAGLNKNIKIAVMGCVVNGPGEAREADIGIAGGDGCAMLFRKGEIIRKINEDEIIPELLREIEKL